MIYKIHLTFIFIMYPQADLKNEVVFFYIVLYLNTFNMCKSSLKFDLI